MDILISFWGEDNKKVNIRFFNSSFLDEATATDIQEAFMSGIKELEKINFLQISSDGPNLNLNRETEEFSPLMDIGTYGLHTVHTSLNAGIDGGLQGKS